MANFSQEIDGLIEREGGFNSTPDDSGGVTKYGISQASFPGLDIASITRQDAKDIYFSKYWSPLNCDAIVDQRLAGVLFDHGVNAGTRRAAKTLQALVGVRIDGIIGTKSIAVINSAGDADLSLRYTLQRIAYYSGVAGHRRSQLKFLVGWINRALDAAGVE